MDGKKFDTGKTPWHLIPWKALEKVVGVLAFGANKYDADNWQKVPDARNRYFSATVRHITAWFAGERNDKETGINHLAHAICGLLFLLAKDIDNGIGGAPMKIFKTNNRIKYLRITTREKTIPCPICKHNKSYGKPAPSECPHYYSASMTKQGKFRIIFEIPQEQENAYFTVPLDADIEVFDSKRGL